MSSRGKTSMPIGAPILVDLGTEPVDSMRAAVVTPVTSADAAFAPARPRSRRRRITATAPRLQRWLWALAMAGLIGAACAADYAPPTSADAVLAVRGAVVVATAAGGGPRARLDAFGALAWCEVVAADATSVSLHSGGSSVSLPWSALRPDQVLALGEAMAARDQAHALVAADLLIAVNERARAEVLLRKVSAEPSDRFAAAQERVRFLRGPAADAAAGEGGGGIAITTTSSALDPRAALKLAMDRSVAGVDRRFGPDASAYRGGDRDIPSIYLAPAKGGGGARTWQIGGPWNAGNAGDYSSAQGQVLYAGAGLGIDRVTILEFAHGCFTESPEPPWWGGFRPEPHSEGWGKAAGGGPVGISRGCRGWSNCGVVVYANGLVASAGTCTAVSTNPFLRLPEGKAPTAICVTPRNEFALITVCDVKRMRAQLAVVALTGCKPDFAHEWHKPYPGLPSVAMLASMKVVGYVDIPGMAVPTSVSAMGTISGQRLSGPDGHIGSLASFDLDQPTWRDSFAPNGNNRGYVASSGWAMVASTSEDKVAFIDLQPLFAYYDRMYFGGGYDQTRAQGPKDDQWPFTFEHEPAQAPTVLTTVAAPEPTAVMCGLGMGDQARAFIACRGGELRVYAVGGLADDTPAAAAAVLGVARVEIGKNPTCLAYQRYDGSELIAVSRGERKLSWVRTDGSGSRVVRTLRDQRLGDPVWCEVAETHGIETGVVSVCDFHGRKLINYRFTDVVFATNGGARFGMGADGKAEFECGGWLEFPGPPFAISATNVN